MARRRKRKTLAQRIVRTVSFGLPEPVRERISGPWTSLAVLVLLPLLMALGVVQISWNGGQPAVSVNRERASEVRQELRQELEAFEERTAQAVDHWKQPQ